MTQELLNLLPVYGPWLIAGCTFLACMMIPVPTSPLLLAAGALPGTGHMDLPALLVAATVGAICGDVAAFFIARRMKPWLERTGTRRAKVMARTREHVSRYGLLAVFLGRWLITPIGPASNYVTGAAGMPLSRFLIATVPGEALWAGLQLTIGGLFGSHFQGADQAEAKAIAVVILLVLAAGLLRYLWRKRRKVPT